MIIETLKTLYKKDLGRLRTEIELYRDEKKLWYTEKEIANSAGNLCLHLVGNINACIGVGLVKTNYVRQRDLEFSLKDIPKEELLSKIDAAILILETGFNNLKADQLANDFPVVIWDTPTETEYTLVRLYSHFSYHLGQINYHRRLMDNNE
jgi:hypothetical protein